VELLERFNVHPVFFNSKQFRQYIFGNINPKRQIKAQRVIIENLIQSISTYSNLQILCTKSDEVIYQFDDFKDIQEIIKNLDNTLFKYKIFTVERIEDFRVNTFYNNSGILLHKELSGCNGHKYFIYLKKYILNEPLDIRDLYFRIDGDLAIWNIEGLDIKL
jgi:heat shock protein HspQ